MMIQAAIDTSLTCVFAVAEGERILFTGSLDSASRDNDQKLPPWILEKLSESGLKLPEIRRWTVGIGPGSFAGLRSGIAFIKGICAVTGAELLGVPSTVATAAAAQGVAADARIGVLMDGRCGQVIFAPIRNMKLDGEPVALDPEQLLDDGNACDAWITPQVELIPPLPEAVQSRLQVVTQLDPMVFLRDDVAKSPSSEPLYVRQAVFVKPKEVKQVL
ncbi:MAG: tRNA (adenosine(37)-N6)-threonylcarbamoyltransferase complex dimerization subunit type 1 TsaB [Victivallales bacterium]|nr:tRNA (adenosine(37)-N6)-threonylcarbamoyltransferase complex dimerization subunit type 1 TsaB [Victivallales bacterium]